MKHYIKLFLYISLVMSTRIFAIELQRLATTYTTVEDFEKGEGKVCEQATDGCNSCQMKNGKVTACTKMICDDIGKRKCTKFIKTENISFLSKNERIEYGAMKNRIQKKYKAIIDQALVQYQAKINTLTKKHAKEKNKEVVSKIHIILEKFSNSIPEDASMTLYQRNKYYFLKYLSFKLRIIGNDIENSFAE